MGTKRAVKQRRKAVKKYLIQGVPMTQIAERMNVSYSTIRRDRDRIKEDLKENLRDEPIEDALFELDATLEAVTQEYWKIYTEKEVVRDDDGKPVRDENGEVKKDYKHDIGHRMGALRHIKDSIMSKIKVLQRLGIIREEPLKIEGELDNNNVEKALDMLDDEIKEDDEE